MSIKNYSYYSGIGSRNTPPNILEVMKKIGAIAPQYSYILRSGGALGADSAFENGCDSVNGKKQIWNPRKELVVEHDWAIKEASEICLEFPLNNMRPFIRNLIVRNMYQILGEHGNELSSFVVCYTPTLDPTDSEAGGTRYACRLAKKYAIPIYNLRNERHLQKICDKFDIDYKQLTVSINSFNGDYKFLSNMYMCNFVDNYGITWKSSEHYYQANKFDRDSDKFEIIRFSNKPQDAKKLARTFSKHCKNSLYYYLNNVGDDKEKIDKCKQELISIMKDAISLKFGQNKDLREKLESTKPSILVEKNFWNDRFWGVDLRTGIGENHLGKILMMERDVK